MDRERIQSVARAAELLRAFLRPPHSFGVTELSEMTGFTKNLTYRLLQTLVAEDLVVKDPETKDYALSYGLVELGATAARVSTLVQMADATLDALAEETGETIYLIARADQDSGICLARRDSRWGLQSTGKLGSRTVLHAGATPKLLLAYAEPRVIDQYIQHHSPLERFTPYTFVEHDELRAELASIRRQGFSISDQDLDLHVWAVAAPIYGPDGTVGAGVSIAAPTPRVGATERALYIELVLTAARDISVRLAHAQRLNPMPEHGGYRSA